MTDAARALAARVSRARAYAEADRADAYVRALDRAHALRGYANALALLVAKDPDGTGACVLDADRASAEADRADACVLRLDRARADTYVRILDAAQDWGAS